MSTFPLCSGNTHWHHPGEECGNRVMCCICFDYFYRGYLYMAEDLVKVDVCIACAINEGY